MSEPPRLPELDGIRGLAILLVLLFHLGGPLNAIIILHSIVQMGWVGVDLFFVMSGFLIGGIILDNRNESNFFEAFYARRFLRIFPLYYFLLTVVAALAWTRHLRLEAGIGIYFVYLQNIYTGWTGNYGPSWLQPTWSLAVEEHFYLVVPALIVYTPARLLWRVLAIGIASAIILRFAAYLIIPLKHPRDFAYFFTLCRFDELFLGVLLAVAARSQRGHAILRSRQRAWVGLALVLAVGIFVVSRIDNHFKHQPVLFTVGMILIMFEAAAFVVLAVFHTSSGVARLARLPVLRWLGVRAYAIYLSHMPCLTAASALAGHLNRPGSKFANIAALLATLAFAAVSLPFFERPLRKFAHRLSYSKRQTGTLSS